jgi:hypothetical protein
MNWHISASLHSTATSCSALQRSSQQAASLSLPPPTPGPRLLAPAWPPLPCTLHTPHPRRGARPPPPADREPPSPPLAPLSPADAVATGLA